MKTLYESIIGSNDAGIMSVDTFNKKVREAFREVFKDYLDFKTMDYSHHYISYELKEQLRDWDKVYEDSHKLFDKFIKRLEPFYKIKWSDKEYGERIAYTITFNNLPKQRYGIYTNRMPVHFFIMCTSKKRKLFIWCSTDEMCDMFEE